MPVGRVVPRLEQVKEASSAIASLPTLSPKELKGIGAALGVGTLIALLHHAANRNERQLNEEVSTMRAAELDRKAAERARTAELGRARRRTEDHLRVAVGNRGLDVMHPGIDPTSPAFVAEAARRQPMGGLSIGRDRDFFKSTKGPMGVVEF